MVKSFSQTVGDGPILQQTVYISTIKLLRFRVDLNWKVLIKVASIRNFHKNYLCPSVHNITILSLFSSLFRRTNRGRESFVRFNLIRCVDNSVVCYKMNGRNYGEYDMLLISIKISAKIIGSTEHDLCMYK